MRKKKGRNPVSEGKTEKGDNIKKKRGGESGGKAKNS